MKDLFDNKTKNVEWLRKSSRKLESAATKPEKRVSQHLGQLACGTVQKAMSLL